MAGTDTYTVSVVRLRCTPEEFKQALIGVGMSASRVDQVLASIPCTIKTHVAEAVATQYAEVFRGAGAEVLIEKTDGAPAAPAPGPLPVPTVTLRSSQPPAPAPADELPALELTPVGPEPIALDDAPPDEPFQVVSREHGFDADGAGATPRPRFPLHAPVTTPGMQLPPVEPNQLELEAEPGTPGDAGIEVAAVERAPSTHARTAGHQDKQVSFKVVLPPPPQPWWQRRLPHMITAAVLLVIGSYVYGCTKVHGRAIDFRRELSDGMRSKLRAPGTEFGVWTPKTIREAARQVARDHGFTLQDVAIQADKICTVNMGFGQCNTVFNPQNISRLDAIEQTQIARSCPKPDWILGITVKAKSRWGLYSYEVEEVAYVTLTRWSPTEAISSDGRCEENSSVDDSPAPDPLEGMGEPQMPQLE